MDLVPGPTVACSLVVMETTSLPPKQTEGRQVRLEGRQVRLDHLTDQVIQTGDT